MPYLLLAVWAVNLAVLNTSLKKVMDSLDSSAGVMPMVMGAFTSGWTYAVIATAGLSFGLYALSLKLLPLSVIGPAITVIGAVTTFVLGVALFGEALTSMKILGLGLSLAGVLLLILNV